MRVEPCMCGMGGGVCVRVCVVCVEKGACELCLSVEKCMCELCANSKQDGAPDPHFGFPCQAP